ncbi:MAG: hypothetical protein HRU30_12635 [Rhodobacteraceae bacterium]|nr:hypothetical protein [Paracoccaceae bacterium]
MAYPTKVVTCCYCGSRSALVLKGKTQHELACGSCGAPLHDLKMLPQDRTGDRELVKPSRSVGYAAGKVKKPKKAKKKSKKSSMKRFGGFFEDAFDIIEDIFD